MWFGGFFDYPRNWTHVVVTRDNDGVFHEYVNGVPTPRTPLSYQLRTAAGATIGTDASASSSARFDGDVDEVAYYPTALSQTQIEAHYQAAIAVGLNQPPAPVNSSLPTVASNTPDYEVGQRLRADPGIWNTYDVAYRYRWNRCDASGASCTPVSGNEGATEYYRPLYSDAGSTMRVTITASNWSGTTTVDSAPSPVLSAPPAPTYRAAVLADSPLVFSQVEDVDAGMTWRSGIPTSNYLTGLDATGGRTTLGANAASINAPGALDDGRGLFLQNADQAAYSSIAPRVIATHNDWALELWIQTERLHRLDRQRRAGVAARDLDAVPDAERLPGRGVAAVGDERRHEMVRQRLLCRRRRLVARRAEPRRDDDASVRERRRGGPQLDDDADRPAGAAALVRRRVQQHDLAQVQRRDRRRRRLLPTR